MRAAPGQPPLHVLAVIDALGQGGTERSMAESIPPLADRGITVTVAISHQRPGVEEWLRDQGTDVRVLPGGWRRVQAYRRMLAEVTPDLVHSMLFSSNMLTRFGGVGRRVPNLTSLVNTSYSPERRATPGVHPAKLAAVQALDAASGWAFVDAFHAVSEAVRRDAIDQLREPAERVVVVGRGRHDPQDEVDASTRSEVRGELGLHDGDLVVLSVGRHEPSKDHPTLLAAMGPLLRDRADVRLLIAGREGSTTAALEADRAALEHPERVLVLGNRRDMPRVLAAADVFVLTSRYEGMPGALIEAMAMGLPAVATDIAPVREVGVPDETVLVAPAADAVAFRAAITRLLDDPTLRERLGRAGRQRYLDRFTIDVAADGMAALYRRVAAGDFDPFRRIRVRGRDAS